MVQHIGLAAELEIIEVTQWVMRHFSNSADESRGCAKHVLTTAVSRINVFRFLSRPIT
ncbi:MAG: hypothetical protein HQL69_22935 [Magnetococcales bacterium]|nr:hypothetical protein [Magnetococcales bacterium]